MITVTTNYRRRPLVALTDIPTTEQSWFDYLGRNEQTEPRLVRYRGAYYDVYDAMRAPAELFSLGWDGYCHETYFSGVVFRLVLDDYDDAGVIIGRYFAGNES